MKICTETIKGRKWYIAKFTPKECAKIGLVYPTFSVWEHDDLYVYKNINLHLDKTDAEWWWRNSEADFESYDGAIKWCNQFEEKY